VAAMADTGRLPLSALLQCGGLPLPPPPSRPKANAPLAGCGSLLSLRHLQPGLRPLTQDP
jgi:hypothetical protein